MVSGGRHDNMENMPTSDSPQSPGPQQEDHSYHHGPRNLEYQTSVPAMPLSMQQMIKIIEWMRVSPSWQWKMIWSKELGRRKPCLSDHLLGLIPVKCESRWPYSAQHTHNIHMEHTHGEHIHSTCTEHNTHTTHAHRNCFMGVEWGEGLGPFGLL